MYYSYDKLFSYNFLLAFVIGERGVGKSFGAKKAVLSKFLKTGEQFVYLRRYKTELDTALATFWSDLQDAGLFSDHELKVKKSKMLTEFICDKKVCGYAVPLSTANILKSTAFPNVKTIIFDEFLLDTASGSVHSVDEVAYDIIEKCKTNTVEEIVKEITGSRQVEVIVTLESGIRYKYANISEGSSADKTESDAISTTTEHKEGYVTVKTSDGGEEALLVTRQMPEVRGVAIVCAGGDDPLLAEKIENTVTAALNITTQRVHIAGGN